MLTKILYNTRLPDKEQKTKDKIIKSTLVLLLGIALGIFSKWLDNLSIDDTIWWQHLLGIIDLNNFFSGISIWLFIAITISVYSKTPLRASINTLLFFIGMTVSYHLYTIIFSGFNPKKYMMMWYGITLASPILAYISWYSKGEGIISIIISSLLLFVMYSFCFSIGNWYFSLRSILDLLVFIVTVIVIYKEPQNSLISLIVGLIMAFFIRIPFFG